jgi:hypothetical protein
MKNNRSQKPRIPPKRAATHYKRPLQLLRLPDEDVRTRSGLRQPEFQTIESSKASLVAHILHLFLQRPKGTRLSHPFGANASHRPSSRFRATSHF